MGYFVDRMLCGKQKGLGSLKVGAAGNSIQIEFALGSTSYFGSTRSDSVLKFTPRTFAFDSSFTQSASTCGLVNQSAEVGCIAP
jgi:hypothetical protein